MEFAGRTREEALENAMTKLKPFGGLFKDVYGEVYHLKAFYGDDEITTAVFAKPTITQSGNWVVIASTTTKKQKASREPSLTLGFFMLINYW